MGNRPSTGKILFISGQLYLKVSNRYTVVGVQKCSLKLLDTRPQGPEALLWYGGKKNLVLSLPVVFKSSL
jgi:hypothetical protein